MNLKEFENTLRAHVMKQPGECQMTVACAALGKYRTSKEVPEEERHLVIERIKSFGVPYFPKTSNPPKPEVADRLARWLDEAKDVYSIGDDRAFELQSLICGVAILEIGVSAAKAWADKRNGNGSQKALDLPASP